MSILNDDRRYSDGDEYRAWKQEADAEYRREEYYDKQEGERGEDE